MPFDNERKSHLQNGEILRTGERCGACGGELYYAYRALPQHDVRWPSGATSGGGMVERRLIKACGNCDGDIEVSPQIQIDPTIF